MIVPPLATISLDVNKTLIKATHKQTRPKSFKWLQQITCALYTENKHNV